MTTEMVKSAVTGILKSEDSPRKKLQSICNLLREEMEDYHWVGYYFVDKDSTSAAFRETDVELLNWVAEVTAEAVFCIARFQFAE